jgi:hypothetical protein
MTCALPGVGTAESNSLVAEFFATPGLPFKWGDDATTAAIGPHSFTEAALVPQLIYPSPFGAGTHSEEWTCHLHLLHRPTSVCWGSMCEVYIPWRRQMRAA